MNNSSWIASSILADIKPCLRPSVRARVTLLMVFYSREILALDSAETGPRTSSFLK
jgi:hypothetical protein